MSTIKTVDDHCGYAFPWDPLQHITSNNATYHDVHHQSWGVKTNFSQPFFTFWDRFLGTAWAGGDVSARYQRDKISAQKKLDAEIAGAQTAVVNSTGIDVGLAEQQAQSSQRQVLDDKENGGRQVLEQEAKEEQAVKQTTRRSVRRKSGFDATFLANLRSKHPAILHADGMQ